MIEIAKRMSNVYEFFVEVDRIEITIVFFFLRSE